MIDNKKANDWFVAQLFNDDSDLASFKEAGFNQLNTGLQDKSFYKGKPKVQEIFKTENGEFNEVAFNQFYDSALRTYNSFVQNDLEGDFLKDYKFDGRDVFAPKDSNKRPVTFELKEIANPSKIGKGTASLFGVSGSKLSTREIAQTRNVFDYETQTWKDYSPNDWKMRGLNFLFGKSYVMASWDEDGMHTDPTTGRQIEHKAGEYKLDKDGMAYYESLGKRSAVGKEFLHFTDTLTVDGSRWNKYDIFDSDGTSKSVGGNVARLLVSLVPYAIPYVRNIYAGAHAATNFSQAVGVLGQAMMDFKLGDSKEKPKIYNLLGELDSFSRRFEASLPDDDQQSAMNVSAGLNMLGDIVGQLYQQRFVASIPRWLGVDRKTMNLQKNLIKENSARYLKKYGETLEQAIAKGTVADDFMKLFNTQALTRFNNINSANAQLASSMSQYYMAMTQASDVYDTMYEHNFSDEAVALGTLGAVVGFKKIFASDLGKVALSGMGLEGNKSVMKEYFQHLASKMPALTTTAEKMTFMNKVAKGLSQAYTRTIKNPNEFLRHGFGEMFEEISEEMLQDTIINSASLIEWAVDKVKPNLPSIKGNTYSWLESDPLTRYLMAGAGGFVGGTIFTGINKLESKLAGLSEIDNALPAEVSNKLKLMVRNGGTQEALRYIDDLVKKGKTGVSTTLSMDLDNSVEGEPTFKIARTAEESQNAALGNIAKGYIMALDAVINGEGVGVTDQELMMKALNKDERLLALQTESEIDLKIFDDYSRNLNALIEARAELAKVEESDSAGKDKWNEQYKIAKDNIADIVTGKRTGEYAERLAFYLNPMISTPFIAPDIRVFAMSRGINFDTSNESVKSDLKRSFETMTSIEHGWDDIAFKAFKDMRNRINPDLINYMNEDIFKYQQEFRNIFGNARDLSEQEIEDIYKDHMNGKSYKEFFKEYNLNPNNLRYTDDQIKEKVRLFVRTDPNFNKEKKRTAAYDLQTKMFDKWLDNANFGKGNEFANKIGIDQMLTIKNKEQLREFVTKAKSLGENMGYLDLRTRNMVDKLISLNDNFNIGQTIKRLFLEDEAGLIQFVNDNFADIGEAEIGLATRSAKGKRSLYYINTIENKDGVTEFFLTEDAKSMDEEFDAYGNLEPKNPEVRKISKGEVIDFIIESINAENSPSSQGAKNSLTELLEGKYDFHNRGSKGTIALLQDYIMNTEMDRVGLLEEAKATTNQIIQNPVLNSLAKLSKDLIGENVFDILSEESLRYENANSITDYVFSNRFREKQFNQMATVLGIFNSVLAASTSTTIGNQVNTFDFNDIINHYNKANGEPENNIISEVAYHTISQDLADLTDQIHFLTRLDQINSGSKLSESEKTQTRMNTLFIQLFTGNSGLVTYDEGLSKIMIKDNDGQDVALFSDVLSDSELSSIESFYEQNDNSVESRMQSEVILSRIEHSLFEKFNNQTPEIKERVVEQLMELTDYQSQRTTLIKKDVNIIDNVAPGSPSTGLSPRFITDYILTVLSTDTFKFKQAFKDQLVKPDSSYAPFHNQAITIRMAYAMMNNKDLFRKQIELLKRDLTKYYPNRHETAELYEAYENLFVVYGQPGSGKTTSIGWFINKIAQDQGKVVMTAAPTSDQAKKLAVTLGHENSYNKSQLFKSVLSESGFAKYEKMADFFESNRNSNPKKALNEEQPFRQGNKRRMFDKGYITKEDINTTLPDVIIIDEFTHFTTMEMQLLDSLSDKITIIALGDSRQEGYNISDAEFFTAGHFFTQAPELAMSIRSNNVHKKDNLEILSALVRNLDEVQNHEIKGANLFDMLQLQLPFIKFKYWEQVEDDITRLNGDKITTSVTKGEIEGLIKDLGEGEKIALITDNTSTEVGNIFAEMIKKYPEQVLIRKLNEVQGQEFKYTVIDADFKRISSAQNLDFLNNSTLNFLRQFYTLISRSSEGTIIIDRGNEDVVFNESFNKKVDYTNNIELDAENVETFKNEYLEILTNAAPKSESSSKETTEIGTEDEGETKPFEIISPVESLDKEELNEFRKNNTVVWGMYNHFALKANNGKYEGNGVSEDLGEFNFSQEEYKTHTTALAIMRSIFLANINGKNINANTLASVVNSKKLRPFLEKYFNNDAKNLHKQAFNDAKSGLRIKVSRRTDFNGTFNSIHQKGHKSPKKDEFMRLVYSIHLGNNKFLDITLGALPTLSNIGNESFVETIKKLDLSNDAIYYFNINKDTNFKFGNIEVLTNKEEYDLEGFDKNYTLQQYLDDNPNITATSKVLLGDNTTGKYKGQPVIAVSWDLLGTNDNEGLVINMVEDSKNPDKLHTTQIVPVNRIGFTTEEFMKGFSQFMSIHKDSPHMYASYMLSSKLTGALISFLNDSSNFTQEVFPGRTQSDIDTIKNDFEDFINKYLNSNYLFNTSFIKNSKVVKHMDTFLKFIESNKEELSPLEFDETTFSKSKVWEKLYKLIKDEKDIYKALDSIAEKIENGESVVPDLTADNIREIKVAIEKLQQELSKFDITETTDQKGNTNKVTRGYALKLIREGSVLRMTNAYSSLNYIASRYNNTKEIPGKLTNEVFKEIVDLAIEQSGFFPEGIFMEAREFDGDKVADSFYYDANPLNQFYLNAPIQLPRFYFEYSSIDNTPNKLTDFEENTAKPVDNPNLRKVTQLRTFIDNNIVTLPSLSNSSIRADIQTYLEFIKPNITVDELLTEVNNIISKNWQNTFSTVNGKHLVLANNNSLQHIDGEFVFDPKPQLLNYFIGQKAATGSKKLMDNIISIEGVSNTEFKIIDSYNNEYVVKYTDNDYDIIQTSAPRSFNTDSIVLMIETLKGTKTQNEKLKEATDLVTEVFENFIKEAENITEIDPMEFFQEYVSEAGTKFSNPLAKHILNAKYEELVKQICKTS